MIVDGWTYMDGAQVFWKDELVDSGPKKEQQTDSVHTSHGLANIRRTHHSHESGVKKNTPGHLFVRTGN